jgi:hypothetical protein
LVRTKKLAQKSTDITNFKDIRNGISHGTTRRNKPTSHKPNPIRAPVESVERDQQPVIEKKVFSSEISEGQSR